MPTLPRGGYSFATVRAGGLSTPDSGTDASSGSSMTGTNPTVEVSPLPNYEPMDTITDGPDFVDPVDINEPRRRMREDGDFGNVDDLLFDETPVPDARPNRRWKTHPSLMRGHLTSWTSTT